MDLQHQGLSGPEEEMDAGALLEQGGGNTSPLRAAPLGPSLVLWSLGAPTDTGDTTVPKPGTGKAAAMRFGSAVSGGGTSPLSHPLHTFLHPLPFSPSPKLDLRGF